MEIIKLKDGREWIIFKRDQGHIIFDEWLGRKYASFSIDTFPSNYDFKEETLEKIEDIFNKYYKKGNIKPGWQYCALSPLFICSPKYTKEIYAKVLSEVRPVLSDENNYIQNVDLDLLKA